MKNILVHCQSGFNISILCDSFHISDNFIHFTLEKYTICSIYARDVKYFYTYTYRIVNDDYIKSTEMLFENGIILKTI